MADQMIKVMAALEPDDRGKLLDCEGLLFELRAFSIGPATAEIPEQGGAKVRFC